GESLRLREFPLQQIVLVGPRNPSRRIPKAGMRLPLWELSWVRRRAVRRKDVPGGGRIPLCPAPRRAIRRTAVPPAGAAPRVRDANPLPLPAPEWSADTLAEP